MLISNENIRPREVCLSGLRAVVTTLGTKVPFQQRQHYMSSFHLPNPWLASYPIFVLEEVAATGHQ